MGVFTQAECEPMQEVLLAGLWVSMLALCITACAHGMEGWVIEFVAWEHWLTGYTSGIMHTVMRIGYHSFANKKD